MIRKILHLDPETACRFLELDTGTGLQDILSVLHVRGYAARLQPGDCPLFLVVPRGHQDLDWPAASLIWED